MFCLERINCAQASYEAIDQIEQWVKILVKHVPKIVCELMQ